MSLLIRNVLLNGNLTNILIEGNTIHAIGTEVSTADTVIEAHGKAAIPGFVNAHTHAAMTLFRGYADDKKLHDWLENYIWPKEALMTDEHVYIGTKLACLEMIRTGTTTCNDMYWKVPAAVRAFEEMGLRAVISTNYMDFFDAQKLQEQQALVEELQFQSTSWSERITLSVGPHSPYTVSGELLSWLGAYTKEQHMPLHIHVSETEKEMQDCLRDHGKTPLAYLASLGVLHDLVSIAHGVWLTDEEIKLCHEYGVTVVYNPISNAKLVSGLHFPYTKLKAAGVNIALGTDGTASNNNLNMLETMKWAAIMQKSMNNDPTAAPAEEIVACATRGGAKAFGLNTGSIEEGALADIVLVKLETVTMTPTHHLLPNLVYAATPDVIDTVIIDGIVRMQGGVIPGEQEILAEAASCAATLCS